jgi:hypothetical protein
MNNEHDDGKHIVGPPLDADEALRALNAIAAWHVYEINDYPEYWVARSLDEAKAAYTAEYGEGYADDAVELSEELLRLLTMNVAEEGAPPVIKTFREYLDSIALNLTAPEFFASVD